MMKFYRNTANQDVEADVPTDQETISLWPENIQLNHRTDDSAQRKNVDILIASVLTILILLGLLGNAVSFYYFWKKRSKSLPSQLYTALTATDICIALTAIPVAVALFNSRHEPTVFEREVSCAVWVVLAYFLKRMSAFLVMVFCVTRALATFLPFRRLAKFKHCAVPISMYAGFILLMDVVFLSTGWFKTRFRPEESMCEIYPDEVESGSIHTIIYSVVLQIELALPPIVVLITSIICIISLARPTCGRESAHRGISRMKSEFRRASITISLFCVLFTACNIPAFLLQLNYLTSATGEKVEHFTDHHDRGRMGVFTTWYAHVLSTFVFTLINVAVNPCFYILRMTECIFNDGAWTILPHSLPRVPSPPPS